MKKLLIVLALLLSSVNSYAQVPYYKTRYEEGKECRYFFSGRMDGGMEDLVSVQCFDD